MHRLSRVNKNKAVSIYTIFMTGSNLWNVMLLPSMSGYELFLFLSDFFPRYCLLQIIWMNYPPFKPVNQHTKRRIPAAFAINISPVELHRRYRNPQLLANLLSVFLANSQLENLFFPFSQPFPKNRHFIVTHKQFFHIGRPVGQPARYPTDDSGNIAVRVPKRYKTFHTRMIKPGGTAGI